MPPPGTGVRRRRSIGRPHPLQALLAGSAAAAGPPAGRERLRRSSSGAQRMRCGCVRPVQDRRARWGSVRTACATPGAGRAAPVRLRSQGDSRTIGRPAAAAAPARLRSDNRGRCCSSAPDPEVEVVAPRDAVERVLRSHHVCGGSDVAARCAAVAHDAARSDDADRSRDAQ